MRNINELIGIINGISYDGIINKLEVARLSSWVKKNRNLSYEHKQAHLISLVEQVLEDGIITDEEREMLLENCSQYTAFETDSIAKVYELNGIIEGIICDNEINEKEVCRLQDWMRTNESFIRYHKPSKTICEKIDQILEDGIVTQEEQKSLLEMLKKRLNDAQIETKIGYLKNCVKERKNLGIDLIDLLDNADAIDIIHSRAESQLGSTLNSYSGTYVRDPEIVFVSLVLIGMLYYDGAFYESVRKTYKSLYQRYSEQKVEGLIRTLLNNYRTRVNALHSGKRISVLRTQFAIDKKLYVEQVENNNDSYIVSVDSDLMPEPIFDEISVQDFREDWIKFNWNNQQYIYYVPFRFPLYRIDNGAWKSFSQEIWIGDITQESSIDLYGCKYDKICLLTSTGQIIEEAPGLKTEGVFSRFSAGFLLSYKSHYDYVGISLLAEDRYQDGIGEVYVRTYHGAFMLDNINPVDIEICSDVIDGMIELSITKDGDGLLLDFEHHED